jgi:hypothetical protein
MDNLALEIRQFDSVEVHYPQLSDPGRGQIQC